MKKLNNTIRYTVGEWELNPLTNPKDPNYYCIYTKKDELINHIVTVTSCGLVDKNQIHANAKLIATAPELLQALIFASYLITVYVPLQNEGHLKIKNVIKKATEL